MGKLVEISKLAILGVALALVGCAAPAQEETETESVEIASAAAPVQPATEIVIPITVSDSFSAMQQEAILEAVEAWESVSNGVVTFEVTIAATTCDEAYAIHADNPGACHLDCTVNETTSREDCRWGYTQPNFTVSIDKAINGFMQVYFTALHELGHTLGLAHSEGLMNERYAPADGYLTSEQFDVIGAHVNVDRSLLPQSTVWLCRA